MPPANVSADLLGRGRGGGDCAPAGVLGTNAQTTKVLIVFSRSGWACCTPIGMISKLDKTERLRASGHLPLVGMPGQYSLHGALVGGVLFTKKREGALCNACRSRVRGEMFNRRSQCLQMNFPLNSFTPTQHNAAS